MEETRKSNKAQQQEASETVAALKAVAKDSERRYPAVAALTEFVDVDVSVFPARPSWVGPVPSPIASTAQSELTTLEAQERAAAQAEGRVTVHAAAIVKHRALVETCDSTLERLPLIDTAPFVGKYDAAGFAFNEHNAKLSTARMALMEAQSQKQQLDQLAANSAASIAAARARIVEYNADLKTLAFNNTLVRKLKALKPLITDHLWSIVLGAVSSFFSTLRGEQSVVTKDKDGFKVNDKGIDSLSGSTLDVLALAIRCALTKTFVPHASFIILDEPFAACDLSRTGDGLGFLSTIGFNQALLCSHDELSEAVAENVISLGD